MHALAAAALLACSSPASPAATDAPPTPAASCTCEPDLELLEVAIRLSTTNELYWAAQGNATLASPWGEMRRALVARRPRPPSVGLPPQPSPPVGDVPQ